MKLDKIGFAKVIAWVSLRAGYHFNEADLHDLDDMIDFDVPPPTYANGVAISQLMMLMQEGSRKIEAIKMHRSITGYGLKESKDEVEKYWPVVKPNSTKAMLAKIDQQMEAFSDSCYALKGLSNNQLLQVKDFIESFPS